MQTARGDEETRRHLLLERRRPVQQIRFHLMARETRERRLVYSDERLGSVNIERGQ